MNECAYNSVSSHNGKYSLVYRLCSDVSPVAGPVSRDLWGSEQAVDFRGAIFSEPCVVGGNDRQIYLSPELIETLLSLNGIVLLRSC